MDIGVNVIVRTNHEDVAERTAYKLLKDPENWKFYSSMYDQESESYMISLYKGRLRKCDTWD